MKLRNLKYFLSESFRSMFRNRLMTLASVVTVAACSLVLAISYFLLVNLEQVVESFERNITIEVFIDNEATEEDLIRLEQEILAIHYVDGINFISFEEALELAVERLGDIVILGGLGEGVFPRSFEVEVTNLEMQEQVAGIISNIDLIEDIRQGQEAVELVLGITGGLRVVSIIAILFLGMISTIIIVNTIKITVSARKNEISIMKYVGATNSFIRWPFLMEGILIGFLGASIALILSYFIYTAALTNIIANFYTMTAAFELRNPADVFIILSPLVLLLGISIGVLGSASSIRRFLKV